MQTRGLMPVVDIKYPRLGLGNSNINSLIRSIISRECKRAARASAVPSPSRRRIWFFDQEFNVVLEFGAVAVANLYGTKVLVSDFAMAC